MHSLGDWKPPETWMRIRTIDCHTEGEPLRVIIDGLPDVPGGTILERRRYVIEHLDYLRKAIMWEPRGHADMYGCLITPPVTEGAQLGVLFMHNEGYSTMCGHGIIGIATVAFETGLLPMVEPECEIRLDTPAGPVTAYAKVSGGHVRSVRFHNVPSFVFALDQIVEVPGIGTIHYDLAFGGAFYAYVSADHLGLSLRPASFQELVEKGMAIKRHIMGSRPVTHPREEELSFLYGTIFTGPPFNKGTHSRHVCIFAEGEVDRSPTGTGVSGRLALLHARGEIEQGEPVVIESIIGSRFNGKVVATTRFGPHPAVIPEVEGSAYITGRHEFLIDPADPFREGFILR
jgi:trans-L-3-hydroxyproline dehydratase